MARDAHIKVRFPPSVNSHILKRTNHDEASGDGGYLMTLVVVCMVRDSLISSSIGGKWMVGYLLGRYTCSVLEPKQKPLYNFFSPLRLITRLLALFCGWYTSDA